MSRILILLILTVSVTNIAAESQCLSDFHRVVIADDALPVQQEAAKELAHYVGQLVGREIEIMLMSQHAKAKASGLSFFVGDKAAAKAPQFHRQGQDYTRVMLGLLDAYRELAILGLKMDFFSTVLKERREDPAAREALLKQAFALGEKREQLLLEHRDWAGPDEGLYTFTNDCGLRKWHSAVKVALGIEKETALTKEKLRAGTQ